MVLGVGMRGCGFFYIIIKCNEWTLLFFSFVTWFMKGKGKIIAEQSELISHCCANSVCVILSFLG